jgi:hypothetical protein
MPSIEVQIIEGGTGDLIVVPGKAEDGSAVPIRFLCEVTHESSGGLVWTVGATRELFSSSTSSRANWQHRDPDWQDIKGFRGRQDVESPTGEWTRIDAVREGGHIVVYVNGTQANEAFETMPASGRIQLQAELAEIYFRRLELWPLEQAPKPAAASRSEK